MNQPNEGMRERFEKRYTNSVVNFLYKGDRDEVINFIQSEIDLALAKQRSEFLEIVKKAGNITPDELVPGTDYDDFLSGVMSTKQYIISTITKDTKD